MWQELSDLRALFVKNRNIGSEKFRQKMMLVVLYEILKLIGNGISQQRFAGIVSSGKLPRPLYGKQAFDLWQAFLFVQQNAGEKVQLHTGFIQKVAAKVMKHTGGEVNTTIGSYDTSLGDFRLGEDYDEVYPLSDFRKIPGYLETLCEEVNTRIDKIRGVQTVHLAADFMYEFAHIKPFGAGNLETALLLMNYIQMYHGEPLIAVFADDRAPLLDALKRGENSQSPAVFENFLALQQIKFLKQASLWGMK